MPDEPAAPPRSRVGRRRKDEPALSLEQIVSEALALLDEEGLGALSMRRLGTRVGAAATAVYWHVSTKDELIELVVDEVYGEIVVPDAEEAGGWRAAVTTSATDVRAAILRHPWITSVLDDVGVGYRGPHLMRVSDRMLALFEAAGFDLVDADRAFGTVMAYVMGIAGAEAAASRRRAGDEQSRMVALEAAEAAAERYPRLRALYGVYRERGTTHDDDFAYGLDVVLDGIEARRGR
ncbi:TetR/AcrR family transcriptional regulator [Promicromonospora sukumoe]|uniref:TetR/AcrR family transcriptional regulator n=1 Tax=Promicromonospora sukumoe TaxID=88382 RepID=UPI00364B67CD